MSAGSHGGPQQDMDREIIMLAVVFLILVVLVFTLAQRYAHHANAFIGAVAYLHVLPFAWFAGALPQLLDVPLVGPWLFRTSVQTHDFLQAGGYATMPPQDRTLLLTWSGRAALVVYAPPLAWICLKGMDFRPDALFRHRHTLESMIHLQTEDWVTSRVARHVNPARMADMNPRQLAMAAEARIAAMKPMPGLAVPRRCLALAPAAWNRALRPEEWLVAKGLVFDRERYAVLAAPESIARDSDFVFRDRWEDIQIESVSEVLSSQLRTPWTRASDLRPCHRALFAVMALFHSYDIASGNRLLNEIATVSDAVRVRSGAMDGALRSETDLMGRIDRIVSGEPGRKLALHAARHAWVESAFPTFLSVARKDRGVLPSASFLWLKAEDRLLWYVLNNVGNEAIMIEAAGAIAHWRAECQIGKPICRPAVFQAARALMDDYLDLRAERVVARADRRERMTAPGQQIDRAIDALLSERRKADMDGIEE